MMTIHISFLTNDEKQIMLVKSNYLPDRKVTKSFSDMIHNWNE